MSNDPIIFGIQCFILFLIGTHAVICGWIVLLSLRYGNVAAMMPEFYFEPNEKHSPDSAA